MAVGGSRSLAVEAGVLVSSCVTNRVCVADGNVIPFVWLADQEVLGSMHGAFCV